MASMSELQAFIRNTYAQKVRNTKTIENILNATSVNLCDPKNNLF